MKRFSAFAIGVMATGGLALGLAGSGAAAGRPASASSSLPTLTLALNGKSVTVGGSTVSGAVNVVTTVTGEKQGDPTLFRLNNGVSYSQFGQAVATVAAHHGDPNYLDPYGSLVFNATVNKGTGRAQTLLAPGNYFALDTESNGTPPHSAFAVTQSASPATLPAPGATLSSIEFAFRGPTKVHDGELVRFVNDGFLVHMDAWGQVKNVADAKKATALLLAGKDNKAGKLFIGSPSIGTGPLSSGGLQQEIINAPPGVYLQLCFMDTQDGREHTQLGMERMIKVVK